MRPQRLNDPAVGADIEFDRQLGYDAQRDVRQRGDDGERSRRFPGLEIIAGIARLSKTVRSVNFRGGLVNTGINGDTATVTIGGAVTTAILKGDGKGGFVAAGAGTDYLSGSTTSALDIDLGPMPRYSGQFVIEDAAILDTSAVMVWHVGDDETDDEPELDGILAIPNAPTAGQVIVNWHAIPGPVVGSRAFRYLVASAA